MSLGTILTILSLIRVKAIWYFRDFLKHKREHQTSRALEAMATGLWNWDASHYVNGVLCVAFRSSVQSVPKYSTVGHKFRELWLCYWGLINLWTVRIPLCAWPTPSHNQQISIWLQPRRPILSRCKSFKTLLLESEMSSCDSYTYKCVLLKAGRHFFSFPCFFSENGNAWQKTSTTQFRQ